MEFKRNAKESAIDLLCTLSLIGIVLCFVGSAFVEGLGSDSWTNAAYFAAASCLAVFMAAAVAYLRISAK